MNNKILKKLSQLSLALGLCFITAQMTFANEAQLEKKLQNYYPDIKIESITPSPLKGIYEVYMGGRLLYTDENGQYVIFGDMLDLTNKINLSAQHRQSLQRLDVNKLPLDQAIKHVRGNGKRTLYLFSDPLCSYCQQLEQQMTSVEDVTVYLFLLPLRNVHPQSEEVATRIWCSAEQFEAWEDFVLHRQIPKAANTCKNPIEANIKLAKHLDIEGTPAYFLSNGEALFGLRTADQMNALLDQATTYK